VVAVSGGPGAVLARAERARCARLMAGGRLEGRVALVTGAAAASAAPSRWPSPARAPASPRTTSPANERARKNPRLA
jgi:hypothetical protein